MGMRPVTATTSDASGGNKSQVIPANWRANPQSMAYQATVTGAATFQIQYTLADIRDPAYTEAGATWTDILASGSVSAVGKVEQPCTAYRLLQTAGAGSVSCRMVFNSDG